MLNRKHFQFCDFRLFLSIDCNFLNRFLDAISFFSARCNIYISRLCYDQGDHSSWKVMEFTKTIFQAWKVMENSQCHGKSWKIMI